MLLLVISNLYSHAKQKQTVLETTLNTSKMSTHHSNPRSGAQHRPQQRPSGDRPPREPQPIIYSICIPRVFKNISEKRIRAIMYSLKFGFVERVDMVAKKNQKGEEFSRVFVHFSSWNERSDPAMQVRAKLDSGDQVKIVYDTPWYWMISKSKTERPEQRRTRPAPFIDFEHTAETKSPSPNPVPHSPAYCPPSPDYLPHTPPAPTWSNDHARSPRSPSPEPAVMPQRSLTTTVGDSDYKETEEERAERLRYEEEEREAEEEFRRKKEMNALGI